MCFALKKKFRKSPLYTRLDINRQNGRALISMHKSKIVGYSRRALSSIAGNKYFSTGFEWREFFLENTRGVWHYSRVWRQSLFAERLQISTDLRNRRSNWIAKNLSRRGNLSAESVTGRHARLRTRTIAIAIDELLCSSLNPVFATTESVSQTIPKSLRFLAHTPFFTLSPFSITEPTPFGIQSVCMSFLWIILAVYQSRADGTIATRIIGRERCGIENC